MKWLLLATVGLPIYVVVEWATFDRRPSSWMAVAIGVATSLVSRRDHHRDPAA